METMDELKKRLNSSSQYLQSNDMQVVEVKEGYAKVEMIIDEQILNVHGFVHGGALYSLADTAAGAASFTSGRDSVTLSGTINYIKPGRGGKLIGIGRDVHGSRSHDRRIRSIHLQRQRDPAFAGNLYDVLSRSGTISLGKQGIKEISAGDIRLFV